ncbi:MAG: hypothetical protein V2A58_03695 [Planctomycetota bacterium]
MWVLILSSAVVLGLIAAASCRLAFHVLTKTIEERHRAMEELLRTRRPLPRWLRRRDRTSQDRAKRECLKRLDALLTYTRRATTIADEDSRKALITELEAVRSEWLSMDWGAFLSHVTPSS